MKKSLVMSAVLCAIIPLVAHAQEIRSSKVTIGGSEPEWMDAYAVGDSVLLHYMFYSANIEMKKAVWVMPDGTSKFIDLDTEIFSVNRCGRDVYYYVLEEIKKKLYLKAIVERPDGTRFEPTESISIEGDVLDEFIDRNQFVILYNRKMKKIIELELDKMQLVNKREWQLPPAIVEQVGKTPFTFVRQGSFFNSFMGTGKVKLYRESNANYVITVDERHSTRPNKPITPRDITGTHIASMTEERVRPIQLDGKGEFRSWYIDGKLFRYILPKDSAKLEVIDVASGETIAKQLTLRGDITFPVYMRDGVKTEIGADGFKEIIKLADRSDPSISVQLSSDGYVVSCGSKQFTQDAATMFQVGVMFGATGYLIFTLAGGARHSADGRGIDRYYYSTLNTSSAKLSNIAADDRVGIRNDVDRYEMETFGKSGKIDRRGYSENEKFAVSFYYDNGPKTVMVAWFPRNKGGE